MDYQSGYLFDNEVFDLTTTNVYGPGGGIDYDLNRQFSIKVDAQVQHWGYAPTPSGTVYSTVGSVALVYRFGVSRREP